MGCAVAGVVCQRRRKTWIVGDQFLMGRFVRCALQVFKFDFRSGLFRMSHGLPAFNDPLAEI
jgi:hypothetical protein